ncbi:eCIS core domain-containing protein [Bradyrhizobium niftali]|uniref:eCIS core domain-containing protein n=1 Tax=Bradyrhizobium niftali TaxID=2560055 RepID=UPI00384B208B
MQRSCDCGGEAGLSGKCEECSQATLRPQRTTGAPAAGGVAPQIVHDALASSSHFLNSPTRHSMETRLGHDFSGVHIHTGPVAAASARTVHANAYTVGNHVVFGADKYRPGTAQGDRLLAHELTHVKQQAGAVAAGPLRIGPADDAHERAANSAASSFSAGSLPSARLQRQIIQRQEADTPEPTPAPALEPPQPAPQQEADDSPGLLWRMIKAVLPDAVYNVVQGIKRSGVIGYFKDRLRGVFGGIFNGLGKGGGFIAGLLQTFTQLAGTMRTIMAALAHNDCKPLFDAIGQLGDMLQQMAGEAWDKIKEFFAPIGQFFSDLWQKFGAPAVDFLTKYAIGVWEDYKNFASLLWNSVKSIASAAWGLVKDALGLSDADDGEEGLFGWVKRKLGDAWNAIKAELDPILTPIKTFAAKVVAFMPLGIILNLRERIHEWLQHAGQMVRSLAKPQGVTADQASLREKILPAVKASIVALGGKIADAGGWVAGQINGLVQAVTGMMEALRANPVVGAFTAGFGWIETKVQALSEWVQDGVKNLFALAGQGVARLSGFVEPVLGVLEKLVAVIGNVVKVLPDLVLGPVWRAIPDCIRNPIKDFVIQHILSAIPIISTFVKLPEIWGKIKQLVLDFLATVFVKGDLGGAAMMVIRFVLEAAGVKVDLFFSVIGKAIDQIDDILMHPMNFIKNVFGALKKGFDQFYEKIGTHLLQGLLGWLMEPLADLGIKPPREFTLSAILDLVMQILGVTGAKLRKKLEMVVGPTAVEVLGKAWDWISTLVTKGPAALWEQIKGQLSGLWDSVIGGIASWITTDLIKVGIKKLATMSNPAGAIIELIQTVYTTIEFVVTKMNSILSLVDSVLDSIGNIIAGKIDDAANLVEVALEKAVTSVISFLANWLGITNPGEAIRGIVLKIQLTVDKALDWLVKQAIAVGRGLFGGDKEPENPKWTAAVTGVNNEVDAMKDSEGDVAAEQVEPKIPIWKSTYGFTELTMDVRDGEFEIDGEMSPKKPVAKAHVSGDGSSKKKAITIHWVKPALTDYEPIVLAPPADVQATIAKKKPSSGRLALSDLKSLNGSFTVKPTATRKLTNLTIGVVNPISITKPDFFFQAASQVTGDTRKNAVNRELEDWGYNRNDAPDGTTDGDHVMEKQLGGPDEESNVWPLNYSRNRSSGSTVKGQVDNIKKKFNLTTLDQKWIHLKF